MLHHLVDACTDDMRNEKRERTYETIPRYNKSAHFKLDLSGSFFEEEALIPTSSATTFETKSTPSLQHLRNLSSMYWKTPLFNFTLTCQNWIYILCFSLLIGSMFDYLFLYQARPVVSPFN